MSQPADTDARLRAGDEAMFTPFGHPVTTNEVHALLLGTTGLLLGASAPFLGPLLPLYAIIGRPRLRARSATDTESTVGLRTIRHEPWWVLASYIPLFTLGVTI